MIVLFCLLHVLTCISAKKMIFPAYPWGKDALDGAKVI